MGNDWIAKGYMWQSVSSCLLGQPWERWINSEEKGFECWASEKDGV